MKAKEQLEQAERDAEITELNRQLIAYQATVDNRDAEIAKLKDYVLGIDALNDDGLTNYDTYRKAVNAIIDKALA